MQSKRDNNPGNPRKPRAPKGKRQNNQTIKQRLRTVPRQKYPSGKESNLFSHLELGLASVESLVYFTEGTQNNLPYHPSDAAIAVDPSPGDSIRIHPAFVQLGMDYTTGRIHGCSARCAAFVAAFLTFLGDYVPNESSDLFTDLNAHIDSVQQYLDDCRTLPIPLHNILQRCRDIIARLSRAEDATSTSIMRSILLETIDFQQELDSARELAVNSALPHIHDNDIILTYACSQVVLDTLLATRTEGKVIKVIVVDSRPLLEGKTMLEKLVEAGIDCEYVLLTSLTYCMRSVNKVILGAHAMLSNGSLLSRSGTALVAMTAHSLNVPVLVCCESFKFSRKVQIDAISYNELGVPQQILDNSDPFSPNSALTQTGYHQLFPGTQETPPAPEPTPGKGKKGGNDNAKNAKQSNSNTTDTQSIIGTNHNAVAAHIAARSTFMNTTTRTNERSIDNWTEIPTLKLLTLRYDLTPSNLISAVMTEFDTIPPTSASVIVREMEKKHNMAK